MADKGLYVKNGKLYKDGLGVVGIASASDIAKYGNGSSSSNKTSSSSSRTSSSSKKNSSSSSSKIPTGLGKVTDLDKPYEYNGRLYTGGIDIGPATGQNDTWEDSPSYKRGPKYSESSKSNNKKPTQSVEDYLADYDINPGAAGESSSGSYKVTSADKPDRTGYLRSAKELADLFDINYDMDDIRSIYDDATKAKYELLSKELKQSENDFYTNNARANATLLDTLKKATSSAIATGASRGIAGAEQLGLMMDAQQSQVEEATNIAQERANMADEIAAEKAENIVNALKYSNQLKQGLATNSTNIYSPDTQYDVGLLDFFAQMKNVEALFEQIGAEERANLAALLSNEKTADANRIAEALEGDKNRASNERMNAANLANALETARIQAAGYASGGGGSGYVQRTWQDDVKDAQEIADLAYKQGDANVYIAARRQLTGESKEEIQKAIDNDPYFKNSKAWKKAQQTGITPTTTVNLNTSSTGSIDVMTLRNYANYYGTNSDEFKRVYNQANKIVKNIFDNNYR